MKFSGLQKTSLVDYPDKVASVLFTPGCNLRCPFCHNWQIATAPKPPFLQEGAALAILKKRKKYIDAVVVTGGEPCMHKELPRFLAKLKDAGFYVKLDTNGCFPDTLKECLEYVDYVAMDVKTSLEKYKLLGANDTSEILRSIDLLKNSNIDYEFRTTIVPEFVTAEDIESIGEMTKGSKRHALQQFVPEDTLDKRFQTLKPYAPEIIKEFIETLKKYTENVVNRI
ncbi:MAG: anaerobic ribonucleoside-triphosphate reductase activating protein [Candidatus Bathyarchaeota archaeon]|nr:anaerobic ribonucleoside-triphosphate reductase activating protein [Candidatus Bathyarchaeota archaeon]MDD4325146.1 anaerobic ribonucleoside-triphosphate reductase activating protein [Candidatus Bathyarchaeota archaeon]MDT8782071.1 anaerobic ribonucleoside-triphosphate reductase activating protein [Candidatus Bathyarchaeota archaeon]